ncbi:MAG: sigma-70 family RNA polymerase sigma factor [Anaerolineae bacterium]|nr:sigma-70 family RNA polymerase sigma factor [Anaerolineae bacterium]
MQNVPESGFHGRTKCNRPRKTRGYPRVGAACASIQRKAYQITCLITRDQVLAQDVVQDAFIRAYEQLHSYDVQRPFGPWFFKLVANLATRAISRNRSHLSLEGDTVSLLLNDSNASVEELVERAETEAEIRQALEQLPRSSPLCLLRPQAHSGHR